MNRLIVAISLMFALLGTATSQAQEYRYEVGPTLGVTGYLGDVNDGNMWSHPGITAGGIFRYIINSRWAVKGNLSYASISGNSNSIENKFPGDAHYDFKSSLVDLGGQVEFNFLHFGTGPRYKNYKKISPYIVAGLGVVMSSTSGNTNFSLALPLGVGVKYKLKERLNLGFEFTMRKEFGDKIDNLSDLYGVKHSFAKNTDWYSFGMFTVTYEFSKRCVKCHYVE